MKLEIEKLIFMVALGSYERVVQSNSIFPFLKWL